MSSLSDKATICIVGGGNVGTILANSIATGSSGFEKNVLIAARDPAKTIAELAAKNMDHLQVLNMADAIAASDILILAVPAGQTDEAIEQIALSLGNVQGKTIIDATNPLSGPGLEARWAQGTSAGEVLQKYLPDSKVYKAFNTLGAKLMARPKSEGTDMLFCGPDDEIAPVVAAVGFTPRYMGPIRYARNLEAIAELYVHCTLPFLPGHQLGGDWYFALKGTL